MANFNGGNCRLLQDNAPTHVTDLIYEALNENRINWVKKLGVSYKTLKTFNE
jgi:hypothetical protein